jgi:hypothetical protein
MIAARKLAAGKEINNARGPMKTAVVARTMIAGAETRNSVTVKRTSVASERKTKEGVAEPSSQSPIYSPPALAITADFDTRGGAIIIPWGGKR